MVGAGQKRQIRDLTPTLMIPMLGNARSAARMNEAFAGALSLDSEAMTASINHLMVVFIAGKTSVVRDEQGE